MTVERRAHGSGPFMRMHARAAQKLEPPHDLVAPNAGFSHSLAFSTFLAGADGAPVPAPYTVLASRETLAQGAFGCDMHNQIFWLLRDISISAVCLRRV